MATGKPAIVPNYGIFRRDLCEIKNYLNRNKIYVDGVWVEKKRAELEIVVGRKYFSHRAFSIDEFAAAYNHFLTNQNIDDPKLMLQPGQYRSRQNAMGGSMFFLCRRGEKFRYYDIESRDYTELLDTLNLDSYEDTEISTLKFMDDYPELMEKYDLQDQYELHNLLKEIVPKGGANIIQFGYSPMIRFGTSDRPSLFLDLLLTYAPLTNHIRRLEASGITKDDLRDFCDAVYDFVDHRQYFSALSLRKSGFTSPLYDLGFDDWFYANLLYADARFACSNIFTSMIFHAGKQEFTLQDFLADLVRDAGEIDTYDLISMLENEHNCSIRDRAKVLYPLAGTGIYHDKFLDRLYASEDAYYSSLTEAEV